MKGEAEINNVKAMLNVISEELKKNVLELDTGSVLYELMFIYENNDSIYNEPAL